MYLIRRNISRQAISPGIPLAVQPTSASKDFLTVNLPIHVSRCPPVAPVQVPYVPDFWNSARSTPSTPSEPELPTVHVVGGSTTHYDGGPTHNLEKLQERPLTQTLLARDPPVGSFGADFWDSLGLPRSFSLRRSLSEAKNVVARDGSRPLTDDEQKGLYILLAIVGASWLVGALVNRPTAAVEELGTD